MVGHFLLGEAGRKPKAESEYRLQAASEYSRRLKA
jgi:hypothetical protein